MPRKGKKVETSIAELRVRHQYCVSPYEMYMSYARSPQYEWVEGPEFRNKQSGKIRVAAGHCDHPEDPICANHVKTDPDILEAIKQQQQRISGG